MKRSTLSLCCSICFAIGAHGFGSDAIAQAPTQACSLLSLNDLAAAGLKVTGKLFEDQTATLPKGATPWLKTDLSLNQCTSRAGFGGLMPYRLAITHAKDKLERRDWDAMISATNKDEKGSGGAGGEPVKVGKIDCEYLSWAPDARGAVKNSVLPNRIHELYCVGYKGQRQVVLSFNETEKAKLPPPKTVVNLLEKALSKL